MQDKPVALVTGANQGIGLQIAKDLVGHGFTVLVGSRDLVRGEAAATEVGPQAHALQLDVTDHASIAAAAQRVRNEFGRLDVLIQNAAISNTRKQPGQSVEAYSKTTRPSNVSLDEMRAVWDTNVFGVLAVYQAMLPLLREAPAARIVNVSSGVGSLTTNSDPAFAYRAIFGPVYPASKTALNALTVAMALELEPALRSTRFRRAIPGRISTAIRARRRSRRALAKRCASRCWVRTVPPGRSRAGKTKRSHGDVVLILIQRLSGGTGAGTAATVSPPSLQVPQFRLNITTPSVRKFDRLGSCLSLPDPCVCQCPALERGY
jgi:NAD(P)-dependent dehydrogenase (short-subunit alcohol dehydrogenase family)